MASYKVKCSVCGKTFTTDRHNAKYCSALCRAQGAIAARDKWEKDTDYTTKQRLLMRQRRLEEVDAIRQKQEQDSAEVIKELNAAADAVHKEELKEIRKKAKQGDLFAQQRLALEKGDSLAYWRLYKEMILQDEENYPRKRSGLQLVGGIEVHTDNFEYLVMDQLNKKESAEE
jgi:hypothetical protein